MNLWDSNLERVAEKYGLLSGNKIILGGPIIEIKELESIAQKVSELLKLICDIPKRKFLKDYKKMAKILGFRNSQISIISRFPEEITFDVSARADLVRVNGRWLLHELNIGPHLITTIGVASLPSLGGHQQHYNTMDLWARKLAAKWEFGERFAFVIPSEYVTEAKVILSPFIEHLKRQKDVDYRICGHNELSNIEGYLADKDGSKIDFVYRIFDEHCVEASAQEYEPILRAIESNTAKCPMGLTYSLISNKGLLALLWHMSENGELSKKESELVHDLLPRTYKVTNNNYNYIIENQNKLILKPLNYLSSFNVEAGCELSKTAWVKKISQILNGVILDHYVVQELAHPEISNIFFHSNSNYRTEKLMVWWGIFVFGDECWGGLVRGRPCNNSVVTRANDKSKFWGPIPRI